MAEERDEHQEENESYDSSVLDPDDPQILGNWRNRKTKKTFPVDYQRIEQHPESDQDFEILGKLSVSAEVNRNGFSYQEKRKMVDEGVKGAGLSINESGVIQLTLENHDPIEIEVKLNIKHSTVYYYLDRGIKKIKLFISDQYGAQEPTGSRNGKHPPKPHTSIRKWFQMLKNAL